MQNIESRGTRSLKALPSIISAGNYRASAEI